MRVPAGLSSLRADLRLMLREPDFRRLLTTRLVSQAGDGAFTAGIGAYVFFTQNTFPDPGSAAAAFAVLYLPYSLIGPFAGVFIDRWSRRQILAWSALLRAAFVALTGWLVWSGTTGVPMYASVLLVLGVNRFFLSSLSAALPHVVEEDSLVTANSLTTTAGTVTSFLGGLTGLAVHVVSGGGRGNSALVLLAAGVAYLVAGTAATTMRRDRLGPPPLALGQARASVLHELSLVARGLASGAVHAWRQRPAAAALGVTASQRIWYGILFLMSILLYRNYFYEDSSANSSLGHFALVVIAAAIGYGAAAVVTPLATKRLAKQAWMTLLLTAGGIVTGVLGPTFAQPAFLVIAFALGVAAQGITICATTIIQQVMGDAYRGRVFALWDMLFNVPFVVGAVIAAQLIPDDGKSYPLLLVTAAGYLASAAGYGFVSRHSLAGGPAGPAAPGGEERPSASAQRSSS
ncbi:MAG: MFS transporter [Actinobacteria bacterium]|nr:MFS transporter [Actinomycetota bacterium]MBO0786487.1 MFS transporter [Actinomycetota bacterium]